MLLGQTVRIYFVLANMWLWLGHQALRLHHAEPIYIPHAC